MCRRAQARKRPREPYEYSPAIGCAQVLPFQARQAQFSRSASEPGVGFIERAHEKGRKVGLCGQAPSDHPEFAKFLADQAIDSISVTPDALPEVLRVLSTTQ